jgi:hypothetical protein
MELVHEFTFRAGLKPPLPIGAGPIAGSVIRIPKPGATRMLLIDTFDSTVPKSVKTTPRSASLAVIGNMYSTVLSHSNGPPMIAPF